MEAGGPVRPGVERTWFGEGKVALVYTERECDEACAELRRRASVVATELGSTPMIGFDTETVTYLPPHHNEGTSSNAAAIGQAVADEEIAVIFVFHRWEKLYDSFTALMNDESIEKVANNVAHDLRHVCARFSGIKIRGHVELSSRVKTLTPLSSYKLSSMTLALLRKRIDKRMDHRCDCVHKLHMSGKLSICRRVDFPSASAGSGKRRGTCRARSRTQSWTRSRTG